MTITEADVRLVLSPKPRRAYLRSWTVKRPVQPSYVPSMLRSGFVNLSCLACGYVATVRHGDRAARWVAHLREEHAREAEAAFERVRSGY